MNLPLALGLRSRSYVTLIGGGGKTTIMFAAASACTRMNMRVLVTTTTKIWAPRSGLLELRNNMSSTLEAVERLLDAEGIAVIGRFIDKEGKLRGVSPEEVCSLGNATRADVVFCEADGSAGKPLKVHGPNEPVVPPCTTHLLILAGLDAVGGEMSSASIHRIEEFRQLFGDEHAGTITSHTVAQVVEASQKFAPPAAQTTVILNKADDHSRLLEAAAIANDPALRGRRVLYMKQGEVLADPHQTGWSAYRDP